MGPFNSLGPHKSLPCALSNCKWNTPQWLLLDVLPTVVGGSLEAKTTTKQNNKNKTPLCKYKWKFLVGLLKLKVGHYSCLLLFFTTPMHPHLLQQPTLALPSMWAVQEGHHSTPGHIYSTPLHTQHSAFICFVQLHVWSHFAFILAFSTSHAWFPITHRAHGLSSMLQRKQRSGMVNIDAISSKHFF